MSSTSVATVSEQVARPRAFGWKRLPVLVRRVVLLALLIAGWQTYVSLAHPNPFFFATPWQAAKTLWHGFGDGSLARPTWTTLRMLLEGIGIGIAIAAVLTVFAALTTVGDDLLTLLTSILNPLPGVAVLPLAMLWFGITPKAVFFVIANATIWPIAIAVTTGFKTANQTLVAVGRNIGLSPVRQITDVLVPAALPHMMTGLKTAWAFGWRTIIAAELVFGVQGEKGGLGAYLNNARNYFLTSEVFAGLVVIAALGVFFEFLFGLIERRTIVRWGMKTS